MRPLPSSPVRPHPLAREIYRHRAYYLIILPAIVCFVVVKYIPIGGIVLAFKNYTITGGIWGSEWAGLKYFERMLGSADFLRVFRNTIVISLLKMATVFLDAIGYETTPVPGTYIYEGPDSLAELEDIFLKFRNEDPDGNGQRDTFGLMPYQGGASIGDRAMFFPNILGAFGVRLNTWEKMGDDIGFSQLRPAYRDALQYLNDWYERELIHPEFVVTDSAEMRQKFGNGLIGAFESWSAQLTNPSTNQAWGMLKANNPDTEPVIVVSPEGPTGMRGTYSRSAVWSPSSVGANVSDEKLAKILEILDEMYNNTDVFATAFYGIKGTHWDYNEAGDPIRAEGWTAPASFMESGATYFRLTAVPTSVEFLYMGGNTWRYPVNSYITDNQVSLDFGFLPTLDEEFLVRAAEVKTVEDEFFFKAIAGEVDIAAAWDDYVAAWRRAGGDQLLEEITRQYRASR